MNCKPLTKSNSAWSVSFQRLKYDEEGSSSSFTEKIVFLTSFSILTIASKYCSSVFIFYVFLCFTCMNVLPSHICVHCVHAMPMGARRARHSVEPELYHVVHGIESGSSGRTASALRS